MNKFLSLAILLLFVFQGSAQNIAKNTEITQEELLQHVSFLASDSLHGRFPGTTYDRISAKYIKDNFVSFGLKLLADKGYQFFNINQLNEDRIRKTTLIINGKPMVVFNNYQILTPYVSNSLCASAIFVGYGSDEKPYNDYKGVKVKKKWVIMLSHDSTTTSKPNDMYPEWKYIRKAIEMGAAGIIIIGENINPLPMNSLGNNQKSIPIFSVSEYVGNALLKEIGKVKDLKNVLNANGKSLSQKVDVEICGKTAATYIPIKTENVVAMLPGNDPSHTNEYIVVGAHFDHLGMGGKMGSRMPDTVAIHNGADDNASGVSTIMEVAQKLASKKNDLKRNVVFVAFSAEEMGLIGSHRFLDSAVIPVNQIKAMVNLDMVGRLREQKLEISGIKTSKEANGILKNLNADSTFKLKLSPSGYGPSDHASFYAKDIPVFFITTGLHPDYHTPFDDVDKLNIPGMQQVADYTYNLVYQLATMDSTLTYVKSGYQAMPTRSRGNIKVKLGIMPDVSGSDNGLTVLAVSEGKPGSKAGVMKNDIIVELDGKPVKNIYDYTEILKTLSPNSSVKLVVKRENELKELTVNF
ncbi:MAG TPA: M20/M25/M40 family metallo-hydrolase [Tenuifilaceae bacterium]|nr:M20/M25/M40 family metallo-hydrolase [Tenuifilaceae bacterium]